MQHFFLSLHMDLSESASEGAGWYIQVTSDQGKVMDPVPVSQDAALQLASAAQTALQSTDGEIPAVQITDLVKSASNLIQQALEAQLKAAEDQAARIPTLRRKLGKIPPGTHAKPGPHRHEVQS